jgi:phage recombination protein Bet
MTPSDSSLLRRTITAHLSDDEHALFLAACERSGLDPFARQIYAMRRGNRLVIEATIDGLRISAERTRKYSGQLGPEWCGPDGVWRDIWTSATVPTAARVGIKRSDFTKPLWGKALYSEYVQETEFWRDMPTLMVAKVAEALAFRKAFPQQFSGLYTPEELAESRSIHAVSCDHIRRGDVRSAPLVPLEHVTGGQPGETGTISGSSACDPSESKPLRVGTPGDDPGRGGSGLSPVPAPLQPFLIDGRVGNHRNVKAAFRFIQGELENVLGVREGAETFRRIYMRLPRIFKTREECSAATLACWCELWAEVERFGKREAA